MPRQTLALALVLAIALAVPALAPEALAQDATTQDATTQDGPFLDAEEVAYPETMQAAGQTVLLNGTALRIGWSTGDLYVAGLYLPEKTHDPEAAMAMDGAKALVLTFVQELEAKALCDEWSIGMEDNLDDAAALAGKLDRLCKATPDLAVGDVLVYEYDPNAETTTFLINDSVKATIQGKDFFHALLISWLGPVPFPGDEFKEDILELK